VVVKSSQLCAFENLVYLECKFMPEAQIMPSAGDFRGLVVGLYRISTTSRTFRSPTCDDDLTRDRTDENDTDNRQCLPPPRPPRVCDSEIAKNSSPARATRKPANRALFTGGKPSKPSQQASAAAKATLRGVSTTLSQMLP
jgi:hypothetical protein